MREYLSKLRKKNKLSQQEVADKLSVSRQYYSFIESGDRQQDMNISIASALAKIFGVTVDYIIKQEEKLRKEA